MRLDRIVLFGEDSIQQTIKEVEWYSDQFICFRKEGELELGLMNYCVGFKDDKAFDSIQLAASKSITIDKSTAEVVDPTNIDSFIQEFFIGAVSNDKN